MTKPKLIPQDANLVSGYLRDLGTSENPGTVILSTRTHVTAVKINPAPDEVIHLDARSFSGRDLCNAMGNIIRTGVNYRQKSGEVFRVHSYQSDSSVPPPPL